MVHRTRKVDHEDDGQGKHPGNHYVSKRQESTEPLMHIRPTPPSGADRAVTVFLVGFEATSRRGFGSTDLLEALFHSASFPQKIVSRLS